MPSQPNLHNEYPARAANIPFEKGNVSRLKLRVANTTSNETILNKALNHYIIHYFPEFYRNMEDNTFSGDSTNYEELRISLRTGLHIENPGFDTKPPSAYKFVITRLDIGRSLYKLRNEWLREGKLPDFQTNLEFFNAQQNIGPNVLTQTQFPLEKVGDNVSSLDSLMNSFASQKNNYNGALPIGGVNFLGLNIGIQSFISAVIMEIVKDIEGTTNGKYTPVEGDLVTFYFSERTGPPPDSPITALPDPLGLFSNQIALNGVVYFSADALATDFLKVGYFTNIKYKKLFSDQATLKILQNYEEVLRLGEDYAAIGKPFPMLEFINQTIPGQIGTGTAADRFFNFSNDTNNSDLSLMEKEAIRLGIFDVNDTDELRLGIKALSSTQLTQVRREVAKNPELYERVYQDEKKKKLETGVNIAKTIGDVLRAGPMGAISSNSPVGRILEQIGLKALAKEALICITFGINIELARIADIVGDTLEEELNERPAMDPAQFPLFKIKGDIGKMVLDAILDGLKSALMSVIKTLAEQLQEVCNLNNPRASDFGAVDLSNLIPPGALDPFGYGNNDNSPLGDLVNMLGMTPGEVQQYLRDVSEILSSVDICILLMDIESATEELIDRIIDFNLEYPNPSISTKLVSRTPVIEFWTLLGNIVDVSELCNEILNDISLLNQNNICLDVDALDDEEMQNIEDLLEIIENGFQESPPVFNFDCPDAENYINDPVMTRMIPETLSTMVEIVEMQFIYSTDSIKNVLLESVLGSAVAGLDPSRPAPGESAYTTALAMNPDASDFPELPKPNPAALEKVAVALQKLSDDPSGILQSLETCIIDAPNLLSSGVKDASTAIQMIIDILGDQEVQGALSNVQNKMVEISGSTGPVVNVYRFNQEFYNLFANYIDIQKADYVTGAETTTRRDELLSAIDLVQTPLADPETSVRLHPRLERQLIRLQRTLDQINQETENETFRIQDHFKRYKLNGSPESHIQFTFPRFNAPDKQFIELEYPPYNTPATPRSPFFELSALFTDETEEEFRTEIAGSNTGGLIPYTMDPFVDAAINAPGYNITAENAQRKYFPFAYGVITDQIFNYYINNGIFDAATLQSLSFFHDNANCAADEISDLLDVTGIFKQMQEEYLEEACNNNPDTARERMREVIKFGMFLLLVQVHIAEFVIKNIFVFAAVQLDELFGKEFIISYMRAQVNDSIQSYFANVNEEVKVVELQEAMVTIFNRMMSRPNVIAAGGVTDANGEVIFPIGTVFVIAGTPTTVAPGSTISNFNDIVSFVALYRIQTSMGSVSSPGPVSNAVRNSLPVINQKTTEEIFLSSMPMVLMNGAATTDLSSTNASFRNVALEQLRSALGNQDGVVIIKSLTSEGTNPLDALSGISEQLNSLSPLGKTEAANVQAAHFYDWIPALFPVDGSIYFSSQLQALGLGDYNGMLIAVMQQANQERSTLDPVPLLGDHVVLGILSPEDSPGQTQQWEEILVILTQLYDNDAAAQSELNDLLFPEEEEASGFSTPTGIEIEVVPELRYDFWFVANDYVNRIGSPPAASNSNSSDTDNMVAFKLFGWTGPLPNLSDDFSTTGATMTELSTLETQMILNKPVYQTWFTTVFDQEIIGTLPIIHNFYLTNNYFRGIRKAMRSTKNQVLDIISTTIANHDNYNQTPDLRRPAARQAALQLEIGLDPESMARDFIIQMLVKTPIDILKGIIQLIDPHVVLSKFVKLGTGEAFDLIRSAMRNLDLPDDQLTPPGPFAPGATGADLFNALLCLLQEIIQEPNFVTPAGLPPENFYPRITKDGVDFLGTGLGMLMLPITPLGLIYLLLQLINFDTQQLNIDLGANFGSGNVDASNGALPGACDDNTLTAEASPPPPAPLESVRPPYTEPEN